MYFASLVFSDILRKNGPFFFWFWEFSVVELFDRTKVFNFGRGGFFKGPSVPKKKTRSLVATAMVLVGFALESAGADLYSADPGEVFIFSWTLSEVWCFYQAKTACIWCLGDIFWGRTQLPANPKLDPTQANLLLTLDPWATQQGLHFRFPFIWEDISTSLSGFGVLYPRPSSEMREPANQLVSMTFPQKMSRESVRKAPQNPWPPV